MRLIFFAVIILGLTTVLCSAEEQGSIKDEQSRESYSLGYQFGSNLKMQEISVDRETLFQAIRDGLDAKRPQLSPEDMRETMSQLRRKALVLHDKQVRELGSRNREAGKAFLEDNKKREGVVALPSGLQYKVLSEGTGPKPSAQDMVKINYRGTLINGTEFDSTFTGRGPAIVRVDDVIRGWTEALQLMKAGSKWLIFVPADLAYGEKQFGRIPPGSTLIFEIELLSMEDPSTLIQANQNQLDEGAPDTKK